MGMDEDGNAVPIDYVLIVVHGKPGYVESSYDQPIYADKLEKKTIDTVFISACNTGNMDFEDNFASQLAMSQDVNQVIAPDGYGKYNPTGFPFFSEYHDDLGVVTGREGNGIIVYQNINGVLVITTNLEKDRNYKFVPEIIEKGRAVGAQNRLKARAEALFSDPGNIPRFPRPDHYNPNPGPFPLR